MARPSALAGLAAALLCVTSPAAAQVASEDCATANAYDTANGAGECDNLIAGGMPCAANFGFGGQYAG